MSLAELSAWCANRFGDQAVKKESSARPFDIPWLVLDHSLARSTWDWQPTTSLEDILDEISRHAEANPDWLAVSATN